MRERGQGGKGEKQKLLIRVTCKRGEVTYIMNQAVTYKGNKLPIGKPINKWPQKTHKGYSMKKTCGAKTYSGQLCLLPSGHQTIHPGVGRCRFHEISDPTFPFKYTSRKIVKGFGICRDLSELKAFQGLDRNPLVNRYWIEPCEIPYFLDTSRHKYIPDLLVAYHNDQKKLIEIKSIKHKIDYLFYDRIFDAKLQAGINYAIFQGIGFELWTYKVNGKRYEKEVFSRNELFEKLDLEVET